MFRRFIIGVDKAKMMLYDVEQSAQGDLMNDDTPSSNSDDPDRRKLFEDFK